jgi:hypothetical protein
VTWCSAINRYGVVDNGAVVGEGWAGSTGNGLSVRRDANGVRTAFAPP